MLQNSDIKNILTAFLFRNKIILTNQDQAVIPNTVNLHWWKINRNIQNVGDMLSVIVTNYMIQKNNICNQNIPTRHLYAIGSIIDGGYQNATIWGSGLLRGNQNYWWRHFRKLDVRCVRGPETRNGLLKNGYSCPEIYGDPAVLMPLIYDPSQAETQKTPYLVIPHYSYPIEADHILSPLTSDWQDFINKIANAKLVISSSLHGIILAEAYGVPAILLNSHNMNLFKYRDYYFSTERYTFPIVKSVEEALNIPLPRVPDLKSLQNNLLNSFPIDLWKENIGDINK